MSIEKSLLKKVEISPRAEEEIKSSYTWYFDRSGNVAEKFLQQFMLRVNFIVKYPESFPVIRKKFREAILFKLPFKIIYVYENEKVIIHSLFHCKRSPKRNFRK